MGSDAAGAGEMHFAQTIVFGAAVAADTERTGPHGDRVRRECSRLWTMEKQRKDGRFPQM